MGKRELWTQTDWIQRGIHFLTRQTMHTYYLQGIGLAVGATETVPASRPVGPLMVNSASQSSVVRADDHGNLWGLRGSLSPSVT